MNRLYINTFCLMKHISDFVQYVLANIPQIETFIELLVYKFEKFYEFLLIVVIFLNCEIWTLQSALIHNKNIWSLLGCLNSIWFYRSFSLYLLVSLFSKGLNSFFNCGVMLLLFWATKSTHHAINIRYFNKDWLICWKRKRKIYFIFRTSYLNS